MRKIDTCIKEKLDKTVTLHEYGKLSNDINYDKISQILNDMLDAIIPKYFTADNLFNRLCLMVEDNYNFSVALRDGIDEEISRTLMAKKQEIAMALCLNTEYSNPEDKEAIEKIIAAIITNLKYALNTIFYNRTNKELKPIIKDYLATEKTDSDKQAAKEAIINKIKEIYQVAMISGFYEGKTIGLNTVRDSELKAKKAERKQLQDLFTSRIVLDKKRKIKTTVAFGALVAALVASVATNCHQLAKSQAATREQAKYTSEEEFIAEQQENLINNEMELPEFITRVSEYYYLDESLSQEDLYSKVVDTVSATYKLGYENMESTDDYPEFISTIIYSGEETPSTIMTDGVGPFGTEYLYATPSYLEGYTWDADSEAIVYSGVKH